MKLNFGAADQKMTGYKSVDLSPRYNPDYEYDITKFPYPKEWEGCEEIRADNIFEHIEPYTLIKVINECRRVLKVGGKLWIRVPLLTMTEENLIAVFSDPTHLGQFTLQTFTYWDRKHFRQDWIAKDYGIEPWKLIRNEQWKDGPRFLIVELEKDSE